MLKVANLSVSIGPVAILRDVSLELGAGEMCGLIGRNGAGKTTLMRALMGALPATGSADLEGTDLLRLPPHRRVRHGIGYMPEDRRLVPEFTVEENIRLPSWVARLSGVDERLEWIFGIMPEVARFRARRALELSGGQQKMVALARALMAGRRMLLLDEPFEGLAPALARRLGEVLANLKTESVSVLLSESNKIHIADLLGRAYRIERGAVTRV
jgi:branched-chain amino acid transport system ATP-binding protein